MDPNSADNVFKTLLENIDAVIPLQEATLPSRQNGVCVPQKRYQRGGRGILNIQGLVLFFLEGGLYLPVSMALRGEYTGLIHWDVPVLAETGDTLTLRFDWPGYPPQDYQVRTIDWCMSPNKISLSRLATEVAKFVDKFVRQMAAVTIAPEEAQWRVGPNGIRIQDLLLAALEQVSTGSWQVRLFYKPNH